MPPLHGRVRHPSASETLTSWSCCARLHRPLTYESTVELQEKLKAGTVYQQLNAYASAVVGLRHATQALADHLHKRAVAGGLEERRTLACTTLGVTCRHAWCDGRSRT